MDRVLHRPHLEALEVLGHVDRTLAVGHVAESVLGPGEPDHALRRKFLQHLLADRTVEHGARVRVVAEQERDVEDRDLGHEVRQRPRRGQRQVERAELHAFDRFALGAERAGVERLDLVAAVGARFDFAREGVDRHAVVRVLRDRDVDLQRRLRGGRVRQRRRSRRRAGERATAGRAHRMGSPDSVEGRGRSPGSRMRMRAAVHSTARKRGRADGVCADRRGATPAARPCGRGTM